MSENRKITPVLLCGGSGTRLWPLSRKCYPKQFVPLVGQETLFQATARRFSGEAEGVSFAAPLTLTNSDFRFIVTEQLAEAGVDPGAILIEPQPRNTAPAILAAALYLRKQNPDTIMLVSPSDHVVPDYAAFHQAVYQGLTAVDAGEIVTFGITPTHPETGYGYLNLVEKGDGNGVPIKLKRFLEKPDIAHATQMVADGLHLWNGGIFLASVKDVITAYETHASTLVGPVQAALDQAKTDLGFLRLAPEPWSAADDISVDYAVMEHAKNLSVVPYSGGWSDLGGWDAVWRESNPDEAGVVTSAGATAIECEGSLLRSESETMELVGIGLTNIMAIAMNDAVLVADMGRAQDVRKAVDALKAQKKPQATAFPKDHRPWGWFESLVIGDRFQVKRIYVHPGAALSLQSHVHRAEHWIVVAGTAKVTIDETVTLVAENESVFVPLGAKHRMENPGKVPMVLIEVQTGAYLGEDDIVRYEDVYARN